MIYFGSTIFFGLVDDLFRLDDFLRARPRFISARRFSLGSSMIYFGSTIFFGLVDVLFWIDDILRARR